MLNTLLCHGDVNSFLICVKWLSNPKGSVLSGVDCTERPHKTFLEEKYEPFPNTFQAHFPNNGNSKK